MNMLNTTNSKQSSSTADVFRLVGTGDEEQLTQEIQEIFKKGQKLSELLKVKMNTLATKIMTNQEQKFDQQCNPELTRGSSSDGNQSI
jgi:hypothetical protein